VLCIGALLTVLKLNFFKGVAELKNTKMLVVLGQLSRIPVGSDSSSDTEGPGIDCDLPVTVAIQKGQVLIVTCLVP
jgi:hypothetical protein